MKKIILSVSLTLVASIGLHANIAPLYEVVELDGKSGLFYNGEPCLYPVYDHIELVKPITPIEPMSASYKAAKQKYHDLLVAEKQNSATFGVYTVRGKKGLMTMSRRTTEPIYDDLKVIRHLSTYKDLGDVLIAVAVAKKGDAYGIINLNGDVIIPFEYSEIKFPVFIDEFEDKSKDRLNVFWAVIDKEKNKKVIDINNNVVLRGFGHESLTKELQKAEKKNNKNEARAKATVSTMKKLAQTYTDLITNSLESEPREMSKCTPVGSVAFSAGTTFGVKDANGNVVVPAIFDSIGEFDNNGVAEVQINGISGFVNEHGFVSYPLQFLSFSSLLNSHEKLMNLINDALDVYPTNTYVWLTAADHLFSSPLIKEKDYDAAAQFYDMAVAMAEDRGEKHFLSKQDLSNREKAHAYANGTASPIEDKIEQSGWAWATEFFNSVANFSSAIQDFKHPGVSASVPTDANAGEPIGNTNGHRKSASGAGKSDSYGSLPETTAMNSDKRVYGSYESQLIKMRSGNDEYNDSRRREIQRKMKNIRTKWEKKGYDFYHCEVEDWGGK